MKLTETQYQNQIIDLAKLYGWKVYHTWRSDHSEAGFPDLTMVHVGQRRLVFAELKIAPKGPSVKQQEWLSALLMTSRVEVYVWTWPDNSIEEITGILRA